MKKELSMEARLLIAFVLMGLVLFITPYIYKPAAPPAPAAKTTEVAKTTEATKTTEAPPAAASTPPTTPAAPAAAPPPVEMPGQIHGDKEETIVIDTQLAHVVFSSRGAIVKSWVLKNFKDHSGKPLDLVNAAAAGKAPPAFAIDFLGAKPTTDPNWAYFKVDRSGDDVRFEFSDGRMDVKKEFEFAQDSYLARVSSQVTQNGVLLPHTLEWRGGFGDETVTNPAKDQHALLFDPNAPRSYGVFNNELQKKDAGSAKNGPASFKGDFTFAGMEDAYFASVFLPEGSPTLQLTAFSDQIPTGGKDVARVGAGVGGEGLNSFEVFVGPKDLEILKQVNPKLEQVVDWGTFEIVAKPLFEILKWTAVKVSGNNYGWAIIIVTIAVNMLLFPLKITSLKSSKKMQAIQPQIKAINEKYKGLSLNDPKKADQNAEIMDLYKKNGVNPAGGCLPMLLQLPFFYAFYRVLAVAIQLRGAHWLWVTDLSQEETLAIHVLPLILIATQFLSQRMTPSPGMDPSQQKMMMFMPLILGYMFYFAMSGLVIYWLTSNLVGVAQQWILNRGTPPTPPPKVVDVKPVAKKKK